MISFVLAAALSGAIVDADSLNSALAEIPEGGAASGGGIELLVDPRGKVLSCRPIAPAGGAEVVDPMCASLKRARIEPATGADGEKTFGLVRLFVQRVTSASPHEVWNAGLRPELEVTLSSLPSGLPANGIVNASIALAATGEVISCMPRGKLNPGLGRAACDALRATRFDPVAGLDGVPIAVVSNIAVRFLAGA